jgi:hypothetical protein
LLKAKFSSPLSNHRNFVVMRYLLFFLLALALSVPASVSAQTTSSDSVVDGYRHFIMPTGKPIEGGYFGFWELGFMQAGYGFGDVLSVAGGFTIMPTVAFRSQFGFLQSKLTLYDDQGLSLAAGLNYLRLTSDNTLLHLFGALTYETPDQTRFTGLFFYKIYANTPNGSNTTLITVNVVPYGAFTFNYTGGLGAGLGFDTPLTNNKNMRFVGEIWNHDLSDPTALGVVAALRLESENFSSDFGFMYFTLPLIAPVANFVWRF